MNDLERSIIEWINANDLSKKCKNIDELSDGILLTELMGDVAPNYFDPLQLNRE